MAIKKKFEIIKDLKVFPSNKDTIEVIPTDGYNGAHRYRARMCAGFNSKKNTTEYADKTDTIQFVQKNEDGSITPGWQSEQLVLILLDRIKKFHEKFPAPQTEKQIQGLQMYLDACKERIEDRMNRGVMGKLKS